MKKRVYGRKLSRSTTARRSLWRSLMRSFIITGSISTTMAKAKGVQPQVEKILHVAGKNTLAARRQILSILGNDVKTTDSVFKVLSNFSGIKSGFTRIIPLSSRLGDGARMARLEWAREVKKTEEKREEKSEKKEKKIEKTEKTKKVKAVKKTVKPVKAKK